MIFFPTLLLLLINQRHVGLLLPKKRKMPEMKRWKLVIMKQRLQPIKRHCNCLLTLTMTKEKQDVLMLIKH